MFQLLIACWTVPQIAVLSRRIDPPLLETSTSVATMFRPEHLQADHLNYSSSHLDRSSVASSSQSRVLAENSNAANVDALVESLMPKGLSPNKQAVIEQLIMMWVAKSELDVA